jgi:phage terminase small subunit
MAGKPSKLNDRQIKFIDEYLIDRNGTQAAIRAGYAEKGADVQAIRMLGNARVKEKIDQRVRKMSKRADITAQRVIEELGEIAFSNMGINIKAGDKLRGLELLGKHFRLFTDKIEHSDSSTERVIDHLKSLSDELPD